MYFLPVYIHFSPFSFIIKYYIYLVGYIFQDLAFFHLALIQMHFVKQKSQLFFPSSSQALFILKTNPSVLIYLNCLHVIIITKNRMLCAHGIFVIADHSKLGNRQSKSPQLEILFISQKEMCLEKIKERTFNVPTPLLFVFFVFFFTR